MMKFKFVILIFLFILSACGNQLATSVQVKKERIGLLPSHVKWNQQDYKITGQQVVSIGKPLGTTEFNKVFGSKKVYQIPGIDYQKEIAILQSSKYFIASYNVTLNKVNADPAKTQAEIDRDKDIAFQREVLPIIEGATAKEYPREYIKGNIAVDDLGKFNEDATLYFDNSNQVVFLIDKENSKINNIKKELQEKLGEKVRFKKAKHNPKEFTAKQEEIVNFLGEMNIASSAGYNHQTEVIDVKAPLNDVQVQALKEKFGADNLNIEIIEGAPFIPY
ncbi:MAG: hypothetical protein ACQEXQ_29720 [Bacillota bacterium]